MTGASHQRDNGGKFVRWELARREAIEGPKGEPGGTQLPRVVGCRGGSRYVEGCWGLPHLKIKMLLGFLVFGFSVSKLLGFKVIWFLGFNISKLQPSHFTKCPFHVFRKILIPNSRFSKILKWIFMHFRRLSFPTFSFFRNQTFQDL